MEEQYNLELQEILRSLKIFEKMYELIRFVDPIFKKVLEYKGDTVKEIGITCFDFWGKSKTCDNCISMRAFNEDQTFVKVEYTRDRIYMITAIPHKLNDRRIVIELLKDITNSMVFEYDKKGISAEIHSMIDSMNNIVFKDALTEIYNKRYIYEKLPVDLVNAALSGQNISVVMADIDFFKKVNDTYGHLTGDAVLKRFSEVICNCIIRESDWVARFGGEEFLICLPGAKLDRAAEIAESMRVAVENEELFCNGNTLRITASFGVSSAKADIGMSPEELIEQADNKLYQAKSNGRNRIEK